MPQTTCTSRAAHACHCCGLIQHVPDVSTAHVACCARCRARLTNFAPVSAEQSRRSHTWPAALALAALVLYPIAMSLPVLHIQKLGHTRETTIWSGVVQLLADGHLIVGTIVLICSVVVPLAKIAGIFVLCISAGRESFLHQRHQALTFRTIEWLGRWGMIDVLLVAFLVAAVKLGDWVDVYAGPGVLAFAAVVVLSMLSSLTFNPKAIWLESSLRPSLAAPPHNR